MKYQIIYSMNSVSKGFDTFQKAKFFAVTHTLHTSPVIYEYSDDGSATLVWPAGSNEQTEDYIIEKVNMGTRRGSITLQKAMDWAHINQSQLSRDSGVSLATIERILTGKTQFANVPVRNALKLAETLHIDIRDLLDGEAERDP